MGVDPTCFVLLGARNGDKSGQNWTNEDKTGHFGTNWETPPFRIYLSSPRKTALFASFLGKKCGFAHLLAFFLESAETVS